MGWIGIERTFLFLVPLSYPLSYAFMGMGRVSTFFPPYFFGGRVQGNLNPLDGLHAGDFDFFVLFFFLSIY